MHCFHSRYPWYNGCGDIMIIYENDGICRTVLITGSARGIGFAIAKEFAACGCRVVLNCKEDEAQLKRAVEEIPNAVGFRADVSGYTECTDLFAKAETAYSAAKAA